MQLLLPCVAAVLVFVVAIRWMFHTRARRDFVVLGPLLLVSSASMWLWLAIVLGDARPDSWARALVRLAVVLTIVHLIVVKLRRPS